MNPLPRRPPPPGRLRHPALAALAATASAFGQVAPSRPAPADQGRKEMVTLFPFLVSTDRETGWSANDTLSATRTKQALKDVPVNIDAITADFIEDLGLNTADEVANYVANAYAPPTLENDNHSGAIAFRGLTGLTTTRNYFRWCILSDTYNVERIDFGKGSNSLIFGDVEPGGQASVFTKRALMRSFGEFRAVYSNEGAYRFQLDVNRKLRDGLAFLHHRPAPLHLGRRVDRTRPPPRGRPVERAGGRLAVLRRGRPLRRHDAERRRRGRRHEADARLPEALQPAGLVRQIPVS
jgi:outer membrane receptor protein involved in Fe transport